ncbi:MAG: NAD-dependent epimerase/dehydratase family protein [Janthinobacterium lividum]
MRSHEIHRGLVAVTGAGGFIGMHAVAALENAGFAVRSLLGPLSDASAKTCAASGMYADICDPSAIRDLVIGADTVVHMAGPPSVAESLRDPARFARTHVEGTTCVLEACRQAQIRHIVYLSSAEIFGRPATEFVAEDHPFSPRSAYAAAKIGAESMIAAFSASFGLSSTILRPFSVYGPGGSPQSLLGELIRSLNAGGQLQVRDLRPIRDYVYVRDVAAAIVSAVKLRQDCGVLPFNLGTMRGTSVAELCYLLAAAYGSDAQIVQIFQDRRPVGSEIVRLVADNTRARDVLGWTPTTTLEAGLRLTADALAPA